MNEKENLKERRVSHEELVAKILESQLAIEKLANRVNKLESTLDKVETLLGPVADFYGHVQSDLDTLGRFGRFARSATAWLAAILISIGVIVAWTKNGFKFP